MFNLLKNVGPGFLVTAAFIGPGTVITASMAGAKFGFSLIWALVFAVFTTLVLQSMTARLALVTGLGLGENIRQTFTQPLYRWLAVALVCSAIFIGNSAYQGGNIAGAVLGLQGIFSGGLSAPAWAWILSGLAFILLWQGRYLWVERALILLVTLMSVAFVATFVLTRPDISALINGLVPSLPSGSTLTVIALIGTTVVPYNLFLHAASVKQKWQDKTDVKINISKANKDLGLSVSIGGLVSIAILCTAASAFFHRHTQLNSAADLAPAISPLFGELSGIFIAVGLFCAGLSSAITAPLAAAYAVCGLLAKPMQLNHRFFRGIWMAVLLVGVLVTSLQIRPVAIILFAQVANGLLLPLMVLFILQQMNRQALGQYKNTLWQNALGAIVLVITLVLSGKSLGGLLGWF